MKEILSALNKLVSERAKEMKALMVLSNKSLVLSEKQLEQYRNLPLINKENEKEWAKEFLSRYFSYLKDILEQGDVDEDYELFDFKLDKKKIEDKIFDELENLKHEAEEIDDEKSKRIVELIDEIMPIKEGEMPLEIQGAPSGDYSDVFEKLRGARKVMKRDPKVYDWVLKIFLPQMNKKLAQIERESAKIDSYRDVYKTINHCIESLKLLFGEYEIYYEASNICDRDYFKVFENMANLKDKQGRKIILKLDNLHEDIDNVIFWLEKFKENYKLYWDASIKQQIALLKNKIIGSMWTNQEGMMLNAIGKLQSKEAKRAFAVIKETMAENDRKFSEMEKRWPTGPAD